MSGKNSPAEKSAEHETNENPNLTKYLSSAGVAARRKCAELVKAGEITVNGRTELEPGYRVKPDDVVERGGRLISPAAELCYVMLNKPAGYICSADDPFAEKKSA